MEETTTDEVVIPTSHLRPPGSGRKAVVLFFNGTFTPIHKGHVDVLTTAKKYIEGLEQGYDVIGAYMSPCSPRYAAKKLKKEAIPLKDRLAMIRLAVQAHEWVYVDDYESNLPKQYRQFWQLLHNFNRRLLASNHALLQPGAFEIFYLVGNDIRGNVPPQTLLQFMQVVVVINRADDTCHGLSVVRDKISRPERLHVVQSAQLYNLSSTSVRHAVRAGHSLAELTSLVGIPEVARYILQRKLWQNLPPLPRLDLKENTPSENNTNTVVERHTKETVTSENNTNVVVDMDISVVVSPSKSSVSSQHSTPSKSPGRKRKRLSLSEAHDSAWPYAEIKSITPELFTAMIGPHWPHIRVTDLAAQQIGKGVGFGGEVFRLSGFVTARADEDNNNAETMQIESNASNKYHTNELGEDLWPSFVLKMSHGMWNNKQTVAEPHFYNELAPLIKSIPIPKCFFTSIHTSTQRSTLLLEDLSYLQFVNVKKQPATKQIVLSALRAVAKLHAEWWKSPKLNEFDWLPALNDQSTKDALTSKYAANWKQISPHLEKVLSAEAFETCATLALVFPSVLDTLMAGPVTLCHGDYWLGNMLFSAKWSTVHVIDWQSVCRGNPLIDVGFFLYYQVMPDLLREIEQEALHAYHDALVAHGVADFPFDECQRHYDLSKSYACVLSTMGVSIRGIKMQVYKHKAISLTPKWQRQLNVMEHATLPL